MAIFGAAFATVSALAHQVTVHMSGPSSSGSTSVVASAVLVGPALDEAFGDGAVPSGLTVHAFCR